MSILFRPGDRMNPFSILIWPRSMIRSILVSTLAVLFLACTVVAEAQQPNKLARIGFLGAPAPSSYLTITEAFLQGLRELGYVEGKNTVIEYRWAEGRVIE